jgi:hypothetical protein
VEGNRSAIWGGATLGLIVGLILGFFVGSYWTTVLYAVLIGAASGVVANVLAWPSDIARRRETQRRERAGGAVLASWESVLREHNPADFERSRNAEDAATGAVLMVEGRDSWRAGYDSLESFYSAHEAQHPEIRTYAARARTMLLNDAEGVLRGNSAADFEKTPDAGPDCIGATHAVVEWAAWRAGYDSLESFYSAHDARHPDIRVYAGVYQDGGDPERVTAEIADRR